MTAAVAAHIGARDRIVGAEALHAIGDIRGAGLIATGVARRGRITRRRQSATGVPTVTIAVTGGVIVVIRPPPHHCTVSTESVGTTGNEDGAAIGAAAVGSASAAALAVRKAAARSLQGAVMTILSPDNVTVHPPSI